MATKPKPNSAAKKVAPSKVAPSTNAYSTRVCIPEPMPIRCPSCKRTETEETSVQFSRAFGTRYGQRRCLACGFTFLAARAMTEEEKTALK